MKWFKLIFFLLLVPSLVFAKSEIISISSPNEIARIMDKADPKDDLIIFDIHNVILTYKSNLLKPCGQSMIDAFFAKFNDDADKRWAMEKAILLQREDLLIDKDTIKLINRYISKLNNFIFLSSYPIESQFNNTDMELFRVKELRNHGINMDNTIFQARHNVNNNKAENFSIFDNVIFCANNTKAAGLLGLLRLAKFRPKRVYFIDDRLKNLQQVMEACETLGINFTGLYYAYAQSIPCTLNYETASAQLHHLNTTHVWLEEDRL